METHDCLHLKTTPNTQLYDSLQMHTPSVQYVALILLILYVSKPIRNTHTVYA